MSLHLNPIDFFPGTYTARFEHSEPPENRRTECPRFKTAKLVVSYIFNLLLCLVFFVIIIYAYNQSVSLYESSRQTPLCLRTRDNSIEDKGSTNEYIIKNVEYNYGDINIQSLQEEVAKLREHVDNLLEFKSKAEDSVPDDKNCVSIKMVESKIEAALRTYEADGIGTFDFASKNAGGMVLCTPNTTPYPTNESMSLFNFFSMDIKSKPEKMLDPFNYIGNCFAFHGPIGRIRIKLGRKIKVVAVTMDHAPFALLEDTSYAPKEFVVYGLSDPDDEFGKELGKFKFNLIGKHVQTFFVNQELVGYYQFIELSILNNHGNPDFTCIYRFRVHSSLARQN